MLFLTLIVLYFYIREFGSMCAVPNTAVDCSSLMSCYFARIFLDNFEMIWVAILILVLLLLLSKS